MRNNLNMIIPVQIALDSETGRVNKPLAVSIFRLFLPLGPSCNLYVKILSWKKKKKKNTESNQFVSRGCDLKVKPIFMFQLLPRCVYRIKSGATPSGQKAILPTSHFVNQNLFLDENPWPSKQES